MVRGTVIRSVPGGLREKRDLFWRIKAFLYGKVRHAFPFRSFLDAENNVLREMIGSVRPEGQKILDAGSGDGNATRQLIGIGKQVHVVCLDSSQTMLNALPDHPSIEKKYGRLEHTNFSDCEFDGILCIGVTEYLRDPVPTLRELQRISKAGAWLIISFSPPGFWNYLRFGYGRRLFLRRVEDANHVLHNSGWAVRQHQRGGLQDQFLAFRN